MRKKNIKGAIMPTISIKISIDKLNELRKLKKEGKIKSVNSFINATIDKKLIDDKLKEKEKMSILDNFAKNQNLEINPQKSSKKNLGKLFLSIDKEFINQINTLKKEKKIESITKFAEDALKEKLNPIYSNPIDSNERMAEMDELRREIIDLKGETKYEYEKRTRTQYYDYDSFIEHETKNDSEFLSDLGVPFFGWIFHIISFIRYSIYLPLKYLFMKNKTYYIKTEKAIINED